MPHPDHDLAYEPAVDQWANVIASVMVADVLLIGVAAEQVPGVSVRTANPPPLPLDAGTYLFKTDGRWRALVLGSGSVGSGRWGSGGWEGRLDRCEQTEQAVVALQWFEHLWPTAVPVGPRPAFVNGAAVRIKGSDAVGTVVGSPRWDGTSYSYTVRIGPDQKIISEPSLVLFDNDTSDPHQWVGEPPASAEEVALRLSFFKMTKGLSDTIYSFGSSKTVFRSYQFKPVLRMIGSDHKRLLIADEVGLGKTIEAGLVWSELESRARLSRVLVVCPSMLVRKWRDEMRRRFGRTLRILDQNGLEELADLFASGDDHTPFFGVVSLERLRLEGARQILEQARPTFDLVIVDEAHYLRNPESASHELGEVLTNWADALIFLSATPLNLGQKDLFTLMNLLLPAEYADQTVFAEQLQPNRVLTAAGKLLSRRPTDGRAVLELLVELGAMPFGTFVLQRPQFAQLVGLLTEEGPLSARSVAEAKRLLAELHTLSGLVTRTRKVDVPEDKAVREPRTVQVEWSDEEQHFYRTVRAWATRKAKAKDIPPGFYVQMPLRQTASCIPAMIERLDDPALDDDEELVDFEADWAGGTDDSDLPADLLAELRRLAPGIRRDTKYERFKEALDEARAQGIRQFMVFSFFRRTLAYLQRQLAGSYSVAVMHGDVDVEDRERIMADFRKGKFEVLLLSEVGSEGLDFEFCNALFNYDLPWNPMRVEQRIGRLDRFGQKHEKIIIYNFEVPGTIETDIFARLYMRLRVFEESIGELEPVLRDEFADLQRVALDPRLTEAQRSHRLRQLEVAFEAKERELDDIRASESELMGIDQLVVDGLEADLAKGRFVGPTEVRQILEALLSEIADASLEPGSDGSTGKLVGSADLSRMMHRSQRTAGLSNYSLSELARRFNDSEPIDVTFDSQSSSASGVELLSVGHPIIQTALDHLTSSSKVSVGRFGWVRLESAPPGVFCVSVNLLEVTGLRPLKELWPVAVHVASGELRDDVAAALMAALPTGHLLGKVKPESIDLERPLAIAEVYVRGEIEKVRSGRQEENDRILDARLAALHAEVRHKVARATETLAKVRGTPATRIYEGRIRDLRADEQRREAELQGKREVGVSLSPVAVIAVHGG